MALIIIVLLLAVPSFVLNYWYLFLIYAIFIHEPDISGEIKWFKDNNKQRFNGLD